MHKYITVFFSTLLIFAACKSDKQREGVIDQPQMINLLTDIHLIDGQLYAIPQQPDSLYKYGSARYAAVLKRYHTNDAALRKSLKYYSMQPEVIQDMYETIGKKIKTKIDSLNKADTKKLKTKPNALP